MESIEYVFKVGQYGESQPLKATVTLPKGRSDVKGIGEFVFCDLKPSRLKTIQPYISTAAASSSEAERC